MAFSKEIVKWPVLDLPPAMILTGPNKGMGREDWYLKNFQNKLPNYEHQNIEMNVSRLFVELEKGNHYCFILGLKTEERIKKFTISRPFSIVVTPKLIMTRKFWESIGKPEELSLRKFTGNTKYTGLVMTGRSYTPNLDGIIKEAIINKNLEQRPASFDSIISMMKLNRIHYTLEYPWIISYSEPVKDSELVSVNVLEIEPFALNYVYCPKNSWGMKLIKEINSIIKKSVKDPVYQKQMEKWHDEKSIAIIRKNYHFLLE